ncbi:MAG: LacI family DNA-binding transcriptional regulator [Pseudomonadota bacterium]
MQRDKKKTRRSRATLKDVADKVGVHLSTVSRVLNAKTRSMVSQDVAQRILHAADELGYKTNPFAYALRMNRSLTVGVLIPDLTNPIFPPIIRGIEHALAKMGYTAILADSDNRAEDERVIIERMRARAVDGLILATAHRADDVIETCVKDGIALVLINRTVDRDDISSVTSDDFDGIAQAVAHMANLGHRRIAHIAGPQSISTGFDRYQAFKAAMRKQGLKADDKLIAFTDSFSERQGQAAVETLFKRRRKFTAVVAANDLLALGCYDAVEARGLRCPADISVTGFNDMPFVDKFKPPLTTVRIPLYEMGVKAAGCLLEILSDDKQPPRRIKLTPELIVRGSTAPPKAF